MAHGHIDGVPLGARFLNRRALYHAGVHRDIRRGICGSEKPGHGAESVVLSGGYEDDEDLGEVIYYTGQGGRQGGRQVAEQEFAGLNRSLARNVDSGEPVRLIRTAPQGFRYDGLYAVEDAWRSPGKSGILVCRYRLRTLEDEQGAQTRTIDQGKRSSEGVEKRQETHYRLVRDGAVPDAVKRLYDYRCQVCDLRISTAAGPYAEGAHLVPLGGGSCGDDHVSNVLCLCPNHHVMLDHGSIYLDDDWNVRSSSGDMVSKLSIQDGHPLRVENAQRHRTLLNMPTTAR